MFAYCLNNPVNMVDKTGQDAETLAAEWGATMWWLNFADGLLPIGDIIYWGGLGLLSIGVIISVDYASTTYNDTSYSKPTSSSKQNAETQAEYVSDFGSTTASPSGPNRPQNGRKTNVNKNESPQWRRFDNVKNSRLKTTGRGSNQRFYDWDYTHNDIEVYNYRGEHLGSMDPVTGEMYKPPVAGRNIRALLH